MKKIIFPLVLFSISVGANPLFEKKGGRAPGKNLVIKKSGVPQYVFVKKSKRPIEIPRLDLGEESQVSAPSVSGINIPYPQKIQTRAMEKVKPTRPLKLEKISQVSLVKQKLNFVLPELKKYQEIPDPALIANVENILKIDSFTKEEQSLLQALIILEHNQATKVAAGLFYSLMSDKSAVVRTNATYRYGEVMYQLGFYSEFRTAMLSLLKESSDWQKKALTALILKSREEDVDLVSVIDNKLETYNLDLSKADQYSINRARYYLSKNDLSRAYEAADEIPAQSLLYADALVFQSMVLYRAGKVKEATDVQAQALALLEKQKPDSEIKSVSALTLARLYFQQKQWKLAFNNYLKVYKNHPEWPQAMIEQAWAQILSKDYEGAAGNMFTLHTDFFKSRFAPESYVVRTVGYLNLCQYGDGSKVVFELQKKYGAVQSAMKEFATKKDNSLFFYEAVKTAFKNQGDAVIYGMPKSLVFELARQPEFMSQQRQINQAEDEIQKMGELIAFLQKLETQKTKTDDPKVIRREALARPLIKIAESSFVKQKPILQKRVEQEKLLHKALADKSLQKRLESMNRILAKTLEQAEVLRYELHAGAGEHLRQQLTGADVNTQKRDELKVADGRSMKWDFRGEVWEDELGHFRSSLKNVCQGVL